MGLFPTFQHCHGEHTQELMCKKCFLSFEDSLSFRKHLYFKHENEHQECEQCHQKTWTGIVLKIKKIKTFYLFFI